MQWRQRAPRIRISRPKRSLRFEILSVLGQCDHELPRRIIAHIDAITGEQECNA